MISRILNTKSWLTTVLFFCCFYNTNYLFAQKESATGYIYTTDEQTISGVIYFNHMTPWLVTVQDNENKVKTFSANEVLHFFSAHEGKFVSKEIYYNNKNRAVFLQIVESGNINLLHLSQKHRIFIDYPELTEITNDNIPEIITELSPECKSKWLFQVKNINLNINIAKVLFSAINNEKCVNIPFASIGINLSYGKSTFYINRIHTPFLKDVETSDFFPRLDVYYEHPVLHNHNWHMKYTLSYMHFNHEYNIEDIINNSTKKQQFGFSSSGININASPVYEFNTSVFRPYIMVGPEVFISLKTNSRFNMETFINNAVVDRYYKEDILNTPTFFFGLNFGCGFKYFFLPGRFIALEANTSTQIASRREFTNNLIYFSLKTNIISYY